MKMRIRTVFARLAMITFLALLQGSMAKLVEARGQEDVSTSSQPGDLDPTFGNDGKVTTLFSSNTSNALANAIAIQSDGKIVAAGYATPDSSATRYDFAVARYNVDGTLDTTFGNGGKAITDLMGGNDYGKGLAIQPDGKIIVAGTAYSTETVYGDETVGRPYAALVRYNPDGTLDSDFGTGGKVISDVAGDHYNNYLQAIAIQSDGKIVVAGQFYGENQFFALLRYNPDGILDTAFGDGGRAAADLNISGSVAYNDLAIQPDGKIIIAGYKQNSFLLTRYWADGTLDSSFGNSGEIITSFPGAPEAYGSALALQPDAKIVVVGQVQGDFALVRYNPDGTLDSNFGTDGRVRTDLFNFQDIANDVTIQSDGKIVVVGSALTGGFNTSFGLARLDSNGILDSSFGIGGKVTTKINWGWAANAVVIQSDGKIVVAGYAYPGFALARYLSESGSDDTPPNTPPGNNITVSLASGTTVNFSNVSSEGDTTLTASSMGPTPPSGFSIGDQPTFYDVSTTAVFTPPVTVCLAYDPAQYSDLNPARLLHYENDTWLDVTTSIDTINHIVCGQVNSLSPFVVAKKNFTFLGFYQPVDNLPTINVAKAGQAIPIKWSLKDGTGNYVSNLASVVSYGYGSLTSCSGTADTIEQYINAGSSSLRYDTTANQFILTSKTDKSWVGLCKMFTVTLSDGTMHQIRFQFTK